MNENMSENRIDDMSGNANANNSENRREKDKIYAGLPYLYRSKGLPSEVYEVRFREEIDPKLLNRAIADTVERYPYFAVRLQEEKGDFYAVPNGLPLEAFHTQDLIPLGGEENHYHMMGVSFFGNVLKISFHHGLTDGRGAKSFLETLVNDYADYAMQKKRLENESEGASGSAVKDSAGEKECFENAYKEVQKQHHEKASELSDAEYIDPCENKHELTGKSGKVEGLASKGFKLPKAANKSGHRRYELRFSQKEFAAEGISVKGSDEILFETPYDALAEIITPVPDTAEQLKGIWESFAAAAKASAQAAKEREAASLALSASIQAKAMHKLDNSVNVPAGAMYYDLATGTMKTFDPTKNTKEQLENLVRSTPAMFAS